jgi:hypothetical protein
MSKTAFGEYEKAAGLHCVPSGVLGRALRKRLRPADCSTNDPMHVLVSNGTINTECYYIFKANGWAKSFTDLRVLSEAVWNRPKFRNSRVSITRPFDAHHQKASDSEETCIFKCQASELLTVLPLIRFYVDMKIAKNPNLVLQVRSFQAAHDLLCLILLSKMHGTISPDRIDAAAARHLRAKIAAYSADVLKPKDHQSCMHLGENARRFGRIIDCFCQERKGGTIKSAAESIDFHRQFERLTLLRVIHEEVRSLSDADLWSNRLLGSRIEDFPEVAIANGRAHCACSAKLRWQHVEYHIGDLITVDNGVPLIIECACCLDGSEFAFLVTVCAEGVALTDTAARWKVVRGRMYQVVLSRTTLIKQAALWDFEQPDLVLILER